MTPRHRERPALARRDTAELATKAERLGYTPTQFHAICAKKYAYRTRNTALGKASEVVSHARQRNMPAPHLTTYKCPICKNWHLTHQESRREGIEK